MTCRILSLQNDQEWPKAAQWLKGRSNPGDGVENAVRDMLNAVREKGDDALVDPPAVLTVPISRRPCA